VTRGSFKSIQIHPDWDYSTVKYDADIAVLVLKDKVTFGTYIQPACLPTPTTSVFNTRGTIVGYGQSETTEIHENRPKFVEIASIENEECLWNSQLFYLAGSKRSFCAGELGKNPCRGDSGGGFYVQNGDSYTVNGIVSAGSTNCSASQFVMFTSVPKFVVWIRQEMAQEDGDEEQGIGTTLVCQFEIRNQKCEFFNLLSTSTHSCSSTKLISTTPDTRIASITGNFDYPFWSDVGTVYISDAKVTFIPDFALVTRYFINFNELWIFRSGLKYVERRQLAKIPQLTVLVVADNLIEYISEDSFSDLVNLEILLASDNNIKVLPPKLLWNLPKLKHFAVDRNHIELIPRDFFKNNKELGDLWINDNQITRFEADFTFLLKLKYFDLERNSCFSMACNPCNITTNLIDFQQDINRNCTGSA
jgi:hypothetical protein